MLVELKNFSLDKWLNEVSSEKVGNFLGLVTVSGKRVRIELISKSRIGDSSSEMQMVGRVMLNDDGSEYVIVSYNEKGEATEVKEIHSKSNKFGSINKLDKLNLKMKYEDTDACAIDPEDEDDDDEEYSDEDIEMFIDSILGDAIDNLYDTLSDRLKSILEGSECDDCDDDEPCCKCNCNCKCSEESSEADKGHKGYVNVYYKNGKLKLSELYTSREEAEKKSSAQVKYEAIGVEVNLPCPLRK